MKYKEKNPKPRVIEAITFDELIEYGKAFIGVNMVNGMPWSFEYKGNAITHETDTYYLVITEFGETIDFTPEDILITEKDRVHTMMDYIFRNHYESVD